MRKIFKAIMTLVLFIAGIAIIAFVMMVGKTYKIKKELQLNNFDQMISETANGFSKLKEQSDGKTASDILQYIKEKSASGELDSVEKIKETIKEGADKYEITLSSEAIDELSETIDMLDDMGISVDNLTDEAEKLYSKYGEEFLDHMEEAFVEAAKKAASNTAENIWESAEETFKSLFDL